MEVMLVYLAQTLIIGIVNIIRISSLQDVPTRERKALIFALHFGVFLATYTIYLIPDITIQLLKITAIPSLVFFINHIFSYFYNKEQDSKKQNVGVLMFLPYVRILPMHVVLLFAQTTGGLVIIFLLLKTAVDVATHVMEHAFLRRKEELPSL